MKKYFIATYGDVGGRAITDNKNDIGIFDDYVMIGELIVTLIIFITWAFTCIYSTRYIEERRRSLGMSQDEVMGF